LIVRSLQHFGTARFELTTSRTPSERATRLRYVPIRRILRVNFRARFVKLLIPAQMLFGFVRLIRFEHFAQFEKLGGERFKSFLAVVVES
jgi:hypothetical protein